MQVNNVLIVNLALSDLILCTVVSPMTLLEIVYKRWPGPESQVRRRRKCLPNQHAVLIF